MTKRIFVWQQGHPLIYFATRLLDQIDYCTKHTNPHKFKIEHETKRQQYRLSSLNTNNKTMLGFRVCNRSACEPVAEGKHHAAEESSVNRNFDQEITRNAIKSALLKSSSLSPTRKLSPQPREVEPYFDSSLPPYIPKTLCIPKEASGAPISSRDIRKLRKARSLSPKKNSSI